MQKKHVHPSTLTWNAVLAACQGVSLWQLSLSYLMLMEDSRCIADDVSYSCCIKACQAGQQWEAALSLIDVIMHSGHGTDFITDLAVFELLDASSSGSAKHKCAELFETVAEKARDSIQQMSYNNP
eukprot:3024699-Amphidinium_carterae.1